MAESDPGEQTAQHPLLILRRPVLQADSPGAELPQQVCDPLGVNVRRRRQTLHLGNLQIGRSQFMLQFLEPISDALDRGVSGLGQGDEALHACLNAVTLLDEDGCLLVAVIGPPLQLDGDGVQPLGIRPLIRQDQLYRFAHRRFPGTGREIWRRTELLRLLGAAQVWMQFAMTTPGGATKQRRTAVGAAGEVGQRPNPFTATLARQANATMRPGGATARFKRLVTGVEGGVVHEQADESDLAE